MKVVVCLGNSITNGSLDAADEYPGQLQTLLGSGWTVINSGISGASTPELTAGFATYVTPYFAAGPFNRNVLIVNEIGNDTVTNGASEATARANMQALIALGRSNGWQVLFATTTPRKVGSSPSFSAPQLAAVNSINDFFRSNPSERDGLVDFATDARLSDPTNTTYYMSDGIHPKIAGAAALADVAFHAL